MATARTTNTLFAEAPECIFQIQDEGHQMAREHQNLMEFIDGLLAKGSAPFQFTDADGKSKEILLTSDNGFFRVIMRSQPGIGQGEIQLAFSLRGLYLLGFLEGDKWYMFKDARLDGSGHLEDANRSEWTNLPVKSGYYDGCFTSVKISAIDLAIFNHQNTARPQEQYQESVNPALFIPVVVISEAKRFSSWFNALQTLFSERRVSVVGTGFPGLFKDWSTVCTEILKGPVGFTVAGLFRSFSDAVREVSVLLCRNKVKERAPPEAEFRNDVEQYDEEYDGPRAEKQEKVELAGTVP